MLFEMGLILETNNNKFNNNQIETIRNNREKKDREHKKNICIRIYCVYKSVIQLGRLRQLTKGSFFLSNHIDATTPRMILQ